MNFKKLFSNYIFYIRIIPIPSYYGNPKSKQNGNVEVRCIVPTGEIR